MKLDEREIGVLHKVADALHAGNGKAAANHFMDVPWSKLTGRFGHFKPVDVYQWMRKV